MVRIYTYRIVSRKSVEKRNRDADIPPELEPPKVLLKLTDFNLAKQLWKMPKKQLKQLAQRKINQLNYHNINQEYEWNKKEEVKYWVYKADHFDDNPFGEVEVKLPKKLRVKPSKRKTRNTRM